MDNEPDNFHKMCENLNSKLNNYIQSVQNKTIKSTIKLEFSELSKHWK